MKKQLLFVLLFLTALSQLKAQEQGKAAISVDYHFEDELFVYSIIK